MEEKKAIPFIANNHRPTMKLYRYFNNMEYAIEEIDSGEIFLSLSDNFNDIFDCKIVNNGLVLDANIKGDIQLIISLVNQILLECKEFFVEFLSKKSFNDMELQFRQRVLNCNRISPAEYLRFVHEYAEINEDFAVFYNMIKKSYIEKQPIVPITSRVACFSEVNDSILMWSYYADKHQGVCLEYDPILLSNGALDNIRLFDAFQKVYYSEKQYNNPQFIHSTLDLERSIFTKALCWAHEQEWRIALHEDIERIKVPCLTGIYLGARFREKYIKNEDIFKRIIRKASAEKSTISVYEAIPDNKEYKINFIPILKGGRC